MYQFIIILIYLYQLATIKDFFANQYGYRSPAVVPCPLTMSNALLFMRPKTWMPLNLNMMANDGAYKKSVFEHWHHIEALAERRFPADDNLKLEASQYVLEALKKDDWKKIRAFKDKKNTTNSFSAFITSVTLNLLSDFWNKKFGKQRPNSWLTKQANPLYKIAYQLLIKNKYSKQEVIEILLTTEPQCGRSKIQEIVSAVVANCPIKPEYQEVSLHDNEENYALQQNSLEEQFDHLNEESLLNILAQYLNSHINDVNNPINNLLAFLGKSVRLTEEECMLLRLRYQSGLTASKIGTLVDLTPNQVNKRIKKILAHLRKVFKQAGLNA